MTYYTAISYANEETSLSQISVDIDFLPQLIKVNSHLSTQTHEGPTPPAFTHHSEYFFFEIHFFNGKYNHYLLLP